MALALRLSDPMAVTTDLDRMIRSTMRAQRWIVLAAVVLAVLAGVAIAGVPHRQSDLQLKTLPPPTTTTTAPPPTTAAPTTTAPPTTAPPEPAPPEGADGAPGTSTP